MAGTQGFSGLARARRRRLVPAAMVTALLAATAWAGFSTVAWQVPAASGQTRSLQTGTAAQSTSAATRPNIVFVLTDDLSSNLVKYMPHVRALQGRGTSFTNYTVTDSLCCPSRSSILTGEFPHDTGVFTNMAPDGGFGVFHDRGDESATFATALQGAGYRTAMMGKYLNGYQPADTLGGTSPYVPPGWDEWDVAGKGYGEFNYQLNENHQIVSYGHDPEDYLTDVVSGKGSDFITSSATAGSPFMLEVATFAPHAPYTPAPRDAQSFTGLRAPRGAAFDELPTNAPPWLAKRTRLTPAQKRRIDRAFRKRVQAVQAVDTMVGDLQTTLAQAGVLRNTVFVFSSDNGYHMGEHRLTPGKMTAFDTDVNVPLIVAGPGVRTAALARQPAQNIDLAPTFETIAGLTPAANVDGHTLAPLLHKRTAHTWRDASLVEHHGPDTARADPDFGRKRSGNPPSYQAMRTTRFTYVEYVGGARELYDLRKDPHELHNVVGRLSPARRARLHRSLHAMTTCHGTTSCWRAAGAG